MYEHLSETYTEQDFKEMRDFLDKHYEGSQLHDFHIERFDSGTLTPMDIEMYYHMLCANKGIMYYLTAYSALGKEYFTWWKVIQTDWFGVSFTGIKVKVTEDEKLTFKEIGNEPEQVFVMETEDVKVNEHILKIIIFDGKDEDDFEDILKKSLVVGI